MRRVALFCCGLFPGLVAVIILWTSPTWYTSEDPVTTPFARGVGLAIIVQGVVAALAAALCIGRALVPLTLSSAVPGSEPAAAGGGPVLPICGLLLLLAAYGPLERSQRASNEYKSAQSLPGQIQEGYVELCRQLIPVGRAFAVLWFAVGGALLATPLFLKPRVWQLRRQLNRTGCKIAIGGLLLSGLGGLVWFGGALMGAVAMIGGGRVGGGNEFSKVGLVGILAGGIVAVAGSYKAAKDRPTKV